MIEKQLKTELIRSKLVFFGRQNKHTPSRSKEIIKIRANMNEIENRKTIERIN